MIGCAWRLCQRGYSEKAGRKIADVVSERNAWDGGEGGLDVTISSSKTSAPVTETGTMK